MGKHPGDNPANKALKGGNTDGGSALQGGNKYGAKAGNRVSGKNGKAILGGGSVGKSPPGNSGRKSMPKGSAPVSGGGDRDG